MLSDRVLVRPERLGHCLVDYRGTACARLVGVGEESPMDQVQPDGVEITRRHRASRCLQGILCWLARMILRVESIVQVKAARHWQRIDERNVLNTRYSLRLVEQFAKKCLATPLLPARC